MRFDPHPDSSKKVRKKGTRGKILFVLKLAGTALFFEIHFCFNYHSASKRKAEVCVSFIKYDPTYYSPHVSILLSGK